jgi:hypothetical protein
MDQLQAQRRLVKSPPELWAEVSDEDVLRHHLAAFGAIRITRVEPESTVAWEGDRASGTVSLDSAGWGTRVTLTAVPAAPEHGGGEGWVDPRRWVAPEDEPWSGRPAPVEEEEPEPAPEEPAAVAEAEPEPEPEPVVVPDPPRRGLFARLFGRRRPDAEITPPTPTPPAPDPAPPVPRPDPSPAPPIDPPTPGPGPTPPIDPTPPAPQPGPAIEAEVSDLPAAEALQALEAMLDHLGAAHHRPFSRG